MRKNSNVAVLLVALVANAAAPAYADESPSAVPSVYAGVQALALSGVHRDIAGNQYGIGAGPLVQVRGGGNRLALGIEGLPVVSIPGTRPSVAYGQATPKLGIFNGAAEYAVGANRSVWLGLGETVYNQRTPLPAIGQEVSSRLAGLRYVARLRGALGDAHFWEGFIGATPTLSGADRFVFLDGAVPATKVERASEIDASLALGWRRGASEWLVGVRTLNFAAKFTATGEAADRNVGVGLLLEWRRLRAQRR